MSAPSPLEVGARHPDAGECPGPAHPGLLSDGDHALDGEAVVVEVGALKLAAADAHAVADPGAAVGVGVELLHDDE